MDLVLGMLLGPIMAEAVPYIVNSLGKIKRPKRINIEAALRDAYSCRPIIPYRAPTPYTGGRVKALFIGINYTGTKSELKGCVNDVRQMLGTLQRIQFPISECCTLVDDGNFPNFTARPTRDSIIKHMAWLVYDARPGDVLFFHYSGHGAQTKAERDSEEKYDQCLVPLDYESNGAILDDDLFELLVKRLPAGVRMTAVFDCCHSASMLDLPFAFVGGKNMLSGGRKEMRMVRSGNFSHGDVVMFSGCDDSGTSADVQNTSSFGAGSVAAGGAATQVLTWALLNTSGLSYADIFMKTREMLRQKGYKQVPQLSSSKPIDLYKPFSLFGAITMSSALTQFVPQQYVHSYHPPPPPPQYQYHHHHEQQHPQHQYHYQQHHHHHHHEQQHPQHQYHYQQHHHHHHHQQQHPQHQYHQYQQQPYYPPAQGIPITPSSNTPVQGGYPEALPGPQHVAQSSQHPPSQYPYYYYESGKQS